MLTLRAGPHSLSLGKRPWLMAVVNTNPDSFSDPGARSVGEQLRRVEQAMAAGADIVDVGGESAVTGRPRVAVEVEIERVVGVIARAVGELGALVSVDTHKAPVAAAAVAAGAAMVNDVSGLADRGVAEVCARTGAALVIMHTRAAPGVRVHDPRRYPDVTADVIAFLDQRMARARALGVAVEQLVLDPGPDFSKTPRQTVEVLRRITELHALGRPLLMAISRKDFIGALTGRPPARRLGGTLAALAHGIDTGAHIFRVHDVAAAKDFLTVRDALSGRGEVDAELSLSDDLRWHGRSGR